VAPDGSPGPTNSAAPATGDSFHPPFGALVAQGIRDRLVRVDTPDAKPTPFEVGPELRNGRRAAIVQERQQCVAQAGAAHVVGRQLGRERRTMGVHGDIVAVDRGDVSWSEDPAASLASTAATHADRSVVGHRAVDTPGRHPPLPQRVTHPRIRRRSAGGDYDRSASHTADSAQVGRRRLRPQRVTHRGFGAGRPAPTTTAE
jgi:hypothetical protein